MTEPAFVADSAALPEPPYPASTRVNGWRFEFDTERIRTSDTWGIAGPELRPWLLMLWMTAWDNRPVGLPGDERAIAGQIGMALERFQACKTTLLRGWKMCADGRLYHPVLTERVAEMNAKRSKGAARVAKCRSERKQEVADDVTRYQRVTNTLVTTPITKNLEPKTLKTLGRSAPEFPPGFARFWSSYPNHNGRRKNKVSCAALWRKLGLEEISAEVVAHLEAMKRTRQWRPNSDGESFEPEAERYLRKRNWEDGTPAAAAVERGPQL